MSARARESRALPSWAIGLGALALIAVAALLAFSGLLGVRLPWGGGYEVKAVFESAQSIRRDAPVRIAGVQVGEVTGVEPVAGDDAEMEAAAGGQGAAMVTMELEEDALPLKDDAQFKLRPRLFLEGNYFVDLQPGSPGAREVSEGHVFPVNQTTYSPQLDQVLTTLQSDVRRDLQVFLHEFGDALMKHGGAEGFRAYSQSSGEANKYTSQVNEALLGTEPGDLGGMIRGLDSVVAGLGRNERTLQELVTSFRVVSGSFAAEDRALAASIQRLPDVLLAADPAFDSLNAAFPPLRALAREALPGVRSAEETLEVGTPFIVQVRELVSRPELRGLVADLRPTIPELARLVRRSGPLLDEGRALSSCVNEVILPWANDSVEPVDPTGLYPHEAAGRVFEETGYVLSGLTGIGRNSDANGPYARVLAQTGANVVELPSIGEGPDRFALTPFPLLGSMPGPQSSAKTRFTAEYPCETQEPPSLQATLGGAPPQRELPASLLRSSADETRQMGRLLEPISALEEASAAGEDESPDRSMIEEAQRALEELGLDKTAAFGEGGG